MKNSLEKIENGASEVSVRSLFIVSLPLMLSSLSGSLMLLCDRLFLAHYSMGAFNSIVTMSSVILMLQIGVNVCASTADVFVGQLNGADKKLNLSTPTWQMIWFSLFTSILFLPLAFLPSLYPKNIQNQPDDIFYLQLLIAICPLSPLQVAISSFFIGRKRTSIPFIGILIGNAVNLVLNYLLIFGQKQLSIPEMGIKGAAIATVLGQCTSLLILILTFFSKANRAEYRTHNGQFDGTLMLKILKVGYPNAIAQAIIAGAWSCFFILMNKLGEASITLASFMQTLTGFFVFLIQGLSRGVIAVSANLIGGRKTVLISKVLFSGTQLSILFGLVILAVFLINPSGILKLFFNQNDFEKAYTYFGTLKVALLWGWLAFVFKSIRALLSGLLIASGKTQFVMWNEAISIWLCFIMPIWICVELFSFDVSWAYFVAFLYNFAAVISYYFRFNRMDWEKEGQVI